MATKPKGKPRKAAAGAEGKSANGGAQGDLAEVVEQLALLTAANNLMAQTAFLTVERLRITNEIVDERVSGDFGSQLFERCEKLCKVSDDLVVRLLDRVGAESAQADLIRGLVQMRRDFAGKTGGKPVEQRRLLESLERMYR